MKNLTLPCERGALGGAAGIGAVKRRPPENYQKMAIWRRLASFINIVHFQETPDSFGNYYALFHDERNDAVIHCWVKAETYRELQTILSGGAGKLMLRFRDRSTLSCFPSGTVVLTVLQSEDTPNDAEANS